jgi:hypothetical protein
MICDNCWDKVEGGHVDMYMSRDNTVKYRLLCHSCWLETQLSRMERDREARILVVDGVWIFPEIMTTQKKNKRWPRRRFHYDIHEVEEAR